MGGSALSRGFISEPANLGKACGAPRGATAASSPGTAGSPGITRSEGGPRGVPGGAGPLPSHCPPTTACQQDVVFTGKSVVLGQAGT